MKDNKEVLVKVFISKEEAKRRCKVIDGFVHVFLNNPNFGLVGADWEKKEIFKAIDGADKIEVTGEQAQLMKHGIAVYPKGVKFHSEILFVEVFVEVEDKYLTFRGVDE